MTALMLDRWLRCHTLTLDRVHSYYTLIKDKSTDRYVNDPVIFYASIYLCKNIWNNENS